MGRIRGNIKNGCTLHEAVDEAVNACIESGFLEDILKKNRGEVIQMILTEYDEELHIRTEKQNSYEDGMEEGKEDGIPFEQ